MSLQSTDPIADLLTRIRNAVMVGKNEIQVPSSKLKVTIANELVKANYLHEAKVQSAKPRDILVITINKPGENSNITEITRLSKPGRRVYVGANDIPRVKNGRGMVFPEEPADEADAAAAAPTPPERDPEPPAGPPRERPALKVVK